jgi:hypothetical protein
MNGDKETCVHVRVSSDVGKQVSGRLECWHGRGWDCCCAWNLFLLVFVSHNSKKHTSKMDKTKVHFFIIVDSCCFVQFREYSVSD